jgi:hypothetical protein
MPGDPTSLRVMNFYGCDRTELCLLNVEETVKYVSTV